MNYNSIKTKLEKYPPIQVGIFITYLKQLKTDKDKEGVLKNKWFAYAKEDELIELFEKVAKDNIYIDGDSVTLSYRNKVILTYNYQAYKNLVLNIYPETIFDIQLVYEGDEFFFKKSSGKIIYEHTITDPFATKKIISGAYCIIKNSRGEFLETINTEDIAKMKAVAKTKNIWNEWESEMVLKSVIKRSCKRHFKDIVVHVEVLDNETNDLDKLELTEEQNNLLERTEALLPEKIKDETRDALKDRIKSKNFLQYKTDILNYLNKIEA